MKWVLVAAIVAAFVLGLLFLNVYRNRPITHGGVSSAARHLVEPTGGSGVTALGASEPGSTGSSELRHSIDQLRSDAQAYADSTRRLADTEAAATKQLAEREAEAVRRSAEGEAASLLRAARSDASVAQQSAQAATAQAERAAAEARRTLQTEHDEVMAQLERDRQAVAAQTAQVTQARAALEEQQQVIEQQRLQLLARADELDSAGELLARQQEELKARGDEHILELERIATLSIDDARTELMHAVEVRSRREAAVLARSIESEARSEANVRARSIIVEAVQRCASEQTTETVVSVMHLPSDEMKGRIIGREGRNIRAFEAVTGVNVIIDDTPEAVLLSCFDPTRREVGRLTLEKLVLDGRIHPHRIEEAYEQSKAEVDALCLRAAQEALADVGISDLDARLLPTLGRLRYRTSYGQNVLGHLVETAHISGVMAAELGIEPELIKRCAFLHDIGKALTHEVQGSHAIIGAELLRRYGESEAVAHAVEAHHNEVQPRTIEAVLTQASDACSAARPGARRETLESYIKRLQRIEEIANSKGGVEKVYAMQAGREVRV
ncbi:MAG: metal dependent phosphohydrolase, partial [Pseudonocardiales bacterium]|nr:metal dependent phosphohydrolase [Pseudonocardiales bacterium]